MSNCQLHLQLTEHDGENDSEFNNITENAEIHMSGDFSTYFSSGTIKMENILINMFRRTVEGFLS